MTKLVIAFLAAALASVGCENKDKTATTEGSSARSAAPAGSGSAPAAVSAAVAPAGGECPGGLTKSAENAFCIKLPASMKPSPPYDKDDRSRRFDYGDDTNTKTLTVVITKMEEATDWDDEVGARTDEAKKKKEVQQADLPDGGKYFSWVEDDGKQWITVLKKKDLKLFFCRSDGKPVDPAVIDACKTATLL